MAFPSEKKNLLTNFVNPWLQKTCEAANPQCDCSKCEQNPLCPNCYFKFQDTDCALGAQAQLIQERKEFFERPLAHYYEPKLTRQVKDAEGNTVWVPRDD